MTAELVAALIAAEVNPNYAQLIVDSCAEHDVPVELALAVLQAETGKTRTRPYHGANIYGHDLDACMSVTGVDVEVTEANYSAYLACVQRGGKRNGVGPLQITHYTLQDEAGPRLWDPAVSVPFGIAHLGRLLRSPSTGAEAVQRGKTVAWVVLRRWNGKDSYADRAAAYIPMWAAVVAESPPPPQEAPVPDIWLPGYTRVDLGWDGGLYDDLIRPKLCWHTTEGATLAGAEKAFRAHPPHLGVDPKTGEKRQYVPLNRHAYALAGSESDDEYVIQVEVVGYARESHTWPEHVLRWLGQNVVAPVRAAVGVADAVVSHGFRREGGGIVLATAKSPIRISLAQLRAFSGHLGHQHMPAPDHHWDPGGLPIDRILTYSRAAAPSTLSEELRMIDVVTSVAAGRAAVVVGGTLQEMTGPKTSGSTRDKLQQQINAGKLLAVDLDAVDFAALVDGPDA